MKAIKLFVTNQELTTELEQPILSRCYKLRQKLLEEYFSVRPSQAVAANFIQQRKSMLRTKARNVVYSPPIQGLRAHCDQFCTPSVCSPRRYNCTVKKDLLARKDVASLDVLCDFVCPELPK